MIEKLIYLVIVIIVIVAAIFIGSMVQKEDYDITRKYDQYKYCKSYCNSIENCDIVNHEITDDELICKYYQNGIYKTYSIGLEEFD